MSALVLSLMLATGLPQGIADPNVAPIPASSQSLPAGSGRVPVWAADYMARTATVTRGRALRQAEHFDVIVALRGTYRHHVEAMKVANPDLTLLVYLNGVMAQSNEGTAYPESWYTVDDRGMKVRSRDFGNYLMRPDEPGWVRDVSRRCQVFLEESGYDGCFLDVLGTAPLNPNYVTGRPRNPTTGRRWTEAEWLRATSGLAQHVRTFIAPAPVLGNGLATGSQYFSDPSSGQILQGLTGAMAEQFVRDATAPISRHRSRRAWQQDVRMVAHVASRGRLALTITKLWTQASGQKIAAVQRYAFATFLLGYEPGLSFYSFREDRGLTEFRAIWEADLGPPVDSARRIGGAVARSFERGLVVVNPSRDVVAIDLGGAYVRVDGTVVTNLTLGPHSAAILTRA